MVYSSFTTEAGSLSVYTVYSSSFERDSDNRSWQKVQQAYVVFPEGTQVMSELLSVIPAINPADHEPVIDTGNENKRRNLGRLTEFAALEDNWDEYGAGPLPKAVLNQAGELIPGLIIQPEIFPTAAGTIQMEYEKEDGSYLEFQVNGVEQCDVFMMFADNTEKTGSCRANVEEINRIVSEFYG